MRSLKRIDEFKREAPNAVFTKEQAMQISLRLLKKEMEDPANSPADTATLKKAMEYFSFEYLDSTTTETDQMLDAFNVARLTTEDITEAIKVVLFEAE